MQLNNLPKIQDKSKKRMGRGLGSGKGKTGGRGSKGQKARGKVPASFIGGALPLYKKLPYRRGLGNRQVSDKAIIIKTSDLNKLKPKSTVNIENLTQSGLILNREASKKGVKILADEELKISLTVELPVSKKAKELIEKAGGSVVV
jgi:large subunit ribosomal protein L15